MKKNISGTDSASVKKIITGKKANDKKLSLSIYPVADDIYTMDREVDIEAEALPGIKRKTVLPEQMNEKDFIEDETGEDLDVPGAELDDDLEAIGSEDEENNYYSIGGDDHNDLEE